MHILTFSEYYRRACRESRYGYLDATYSRYFQMVKAVMYERTKYLNRVIKSARIQARRIRFLFTYHFIVKKLHRYYNRGFRQILKVLHTSKVLYIKRKRNRGVV